MSVCEVDLTVSSWLLPRRAVGLWRCCLGFGEVREGVEYLGSWAAAGKQGHFSTGVRLHSAWDSQRYWSRKKWPLRQWRPQKPEVQLEATRGLYSQTSTGRFIQGGRSSRLSEQSVSATVRFNSQSTSLSTGREMEAGYTCFTVKRSQWERQKCRCLPCSVQPKLR